MAVWASALVAFANIGLVAALLYAYFQNYRALRSYFTLGLVLFAFLFLAFNLAVVGLWFFLFSNIAVAELFVDQAMSWMLIINVAQLVGLVSLVRITFR